MLMNQVAPQNEATVRNLITVFESESNAHSKYTAYAERAESEGLHHTAGMLRAVARSEQIYADNHARVIRQLGGEPEAQIQEVEVQTTLENLLAALGDEVYEIESMYPRILVENLHASISAACTLTWAIEGKKTHARLLNEEIRRIHGRNTESSVTTPVEFYVRSSCGYISKTAEPERCCVCECCCAEFETVR